jgi:hypothetical protein
LNDDNLPISNHAKERLEKTNINLPISKQAKERLENFLGEEKPCVFGVVDCELLDHCRDTSCPAGYTGIPGTCAPCAAGKYEIDIGEAACTNCEDGKYSTTVGATAYATCLACPADSTSPSISAAETACRCNAGYTGPNGGPCAPCKPGEYSQW